MFCRSRRLLVVCVCVCVAIIVCVILEVYAIIYYKMCKVLVVDRTKLIIFTITVDSVEMCSQNYCVKNFTLFSYKCHVFHENDS